MRRLYWGTLGVLKVIKVAITDNILSKELLVATEIHAAYLESDKPVHFNQLVTRLEGRVARITVSRALDMLFDQGIVRAEWVTRDDGRYVRQLTIAGEAKDFIAKIHDRIRRSPPKH